MADPPGDRDSSGETVDATGVRPGRGSATGPPRWVKVFGLIALVLVLLFVIAQLAGVGGGHGPGRHVPSGSSGRPTPAFSGTEDHTPPEGGHG